MIYLTGDSHTTVLMRASKEKWPEEASQPNLAINALGPGYQITKRFFEDRGNRMAFLKDTVKKRFFKMAGKRALVYAQDHLYGFSMRLHTFRVCENNCWLTHRPMWDDLRKDRTPLSQAVFNQILDADIGSTLEFYSILIEHKVPFFALESPPLNPNLRVIANGAEPGFILALDRVYRKRMKDWLRAHNIDVVEHPPETVDENGFLKPEYHSDNPKDNRHANTAYGHLMLNRILSYLETSHPDRIVFS